MYKDRLETKDLILRKAKMEDLDSIYLNYWSDERSCKYMLWKHCKNIDEARDKLIRSIDFQKDKPAYFVVEKSSGYVIGSAAFLCIDTGVYDDAGIGMGMKYTGKGYGKQILLCFMNYIFDELNGDKFICSCFRENVPSAKLQTYMGFKYFESTDKVRAFDNYKYICDSHVITKEKFTELKSQNYYKNIEK